MSHEGTCVTIIKSFTIYFPVMTSEQIVTGVHYKFIITIYHTPTAKKILENHQNKMCDISKTKIFDFMLKFFRNQNLIQNNELFGQHLFPGGVG